MKGRDIIPGRDYAVRERIKGVHLERHFPKTAPVRQATVVDKAANGRVVVQYPAMVPDPAQHVDPGELPAVILMGQRRYVPGFKFMTVMTHDIICRWDEWDQDHKPGVKRVGDATFTTQALGLGDRGGHAQMAREA